MRKRYPRLWAKVLNYYAEGSRFTEVVSESIYNWLATSEDIEEYSAEYSSLVHKGLSEYLSRDVMDKKYRNSAHRIVDDELQGQPIYRSVSDQFTLTVCEGN